MKIKDKVFSKFKEFKSLLENHTKKKTKTLRLDNGGEFISESFKYLSKESWIKRELITPFNPQKNGVAGRKNMTIMEVVKAMIHDQYLSMNFWAKESRKIIYF